MPTFNVHIFREMRIPYQDIEADSPQAAAESCRDFPCEMGCDPVDCDGQTFAARVDVQGVGNTPSHLIYFEPERQRRAAPKLLAACRMIVDRWEHGDLAEAARACSAAIAAAEDTHCPIPPLTALKPYSVLLLYPGHANDTGSETYYAWVKAPDPVAAVAEAQRQAQEANEWDVPENFVDPNGFVPLLVTEGHHYGQPMPNQ